MSAESESVEVRAHAARAAKGDPDAWEWLYRRAYSGLFGYARRRLASDVAADDAVSETMTRALENIHRFRWRSGGFEAWLFGILRNIVYETYRFDGRARLMAEPPEPHQGGLAPADPAEMVDAQVAQEVVRQAFNRLTPDEQEVLELRVVAQLSSDDAARVLRKRPGAVRMAQSRAMAHLRTIVEEATLG